MSTMAGFTITCDDPITFTDEEIAERVEFLNALRAEVLPDDPPTSVEPAIAANRAAPRRIRRFAWRLRDADGALAGTASTAIDPDDDNPDMLWASIYLRSGVRRRGLGTCLLAELVALAGREGKARLLGSTLQGWPSGAAFAAAAGASSKLANHTNHLPLAEVDRPMLERWVAEADTRAAEYELIGWDGAVPEEHMAQWLDLVLVMNTAPRDGLEMQDFSITAEEIREQEKVRAAAGYEQWTLVARHRTSGARAGFHDVMWNPDQAAFVHVGATGVRPEHRGHALGKWLKAAMTLRILDERPGVTHIRTGNADSNDAMLGINKEMGYRPLIAEMVWEVPVETAQAWVRARSTATATVGAG